jgi:hypothetical protein
MNQRFLKALRLSKTVKERPLDIAEKFRKIGNAQ